MRQKLLTLLCGMLAGAGGMFLLMSGPVAVVKADCPGEPGTACGNGDVNGDGSIDLADGIYILQYLFAHGPEIAPMECVPEIPSPPLRATGQTTCYRGDSPWHEIDCGSAEFPGQDAYYHNGCPMEERFVDNGDGTVTDTCTGLTWQQETAPGEYTWAEALQYCEDLDLGEQTDWRLPNIRELHSIVDYGRYDSAIDPVFGVQPTSWCWSSTSSVYEPNHAWVVYFGAGTTIYFTKTIHDHVRAVRGGL